MFEGSAVGMFFSPCHHSMPFLFLEIVGVGDLLLTSCNKKLKPQDLGENHFERQKDFDASPAENQLSKYSVEILHLKVISVRKSFKSIMEC